MSETIEITIQKNGNFQVETSGFTGTRCKSITQALEQIGQSTTELKPEYFQREEGETNVLEVENR